MPDNVQVQVETLGSGLTQGARRATEVSPEPAAAGRGIAEHQRWTASRRRDVVLRLVRGESLDAVSRDTGVEIYRLEQWRSRALAAMEAGLRERGGDPRDAELEEAQKKIGELSWSCYASGVSDKAPFLAGEIAKAGLPNGMFDFSGARLFTVSLLTVSSAPRLCAIITVI